MGEGGQNTFSCMPRAGSRPHSTCRMDRVPGVVVPGGHVTRRTRRAPDPGSSAAGAARGPAKNRLDPPPPSIYISLAALCGVCGKAAGVLPPFFRGGSESPAPGDACSKPPLNREQSHSGAAQMPRSRECSPCKTGTARFWRLSIRSRHPPFVWTRPWKSGIASRRQPGWTKPAQGPGRVPG